MVLSELRLIGVPSDLFQNLLAVLDIEALLRLALDTTALQVVDGRMVCGIDLLYHLRQTRRDALARILADEED